MPEHQFTKHHLSLSTMVKSGRFSSMRGKSEVARFEVCDVCGYIIFEGRPVQQYRTCEEKFINDVMES